MASGRALVNGAMKACLRPAGFDPYRENPSFRRVVREGHGAGFGPPQKGRPQPSPRRAASIVAMSIFLIVIIEELLVAKT